MPHFYFHVCNGNGFVQDDKGAELPDAAAARVKAIEGLRNIMASEVKDGLLKTALFIEIEDVNCQLVTTVLFSDAITVEEPTLVGQLKRSGR